MKRRKKLKYTRENRGTLYAIAKEALEWQLDMLSRAAKEMLSDLFPRVPLSKQHRVFEFVKGIRWPYSRGRYDLVAVGLEEEFLHNTSRVAELILHCCDTPDDVMNASSKLAMPLYGVSNATGNACGKPRK